MRKFLIPALLLVAGLSLCVTSRLEAAADTRSSDIAVVDTTRILTASKPAKDGEAHLQKVREVLQKGMEDLQKLYKGKENTSEAKRALLEGQATLERQLAMERQAVLAVLGQALETAVRQWRTQDNKYLIVISRQSLLDSAESLDVTEQVLKEMDKQNPTFPDLPTVTVNPPKQGQSKNDTREGEGKRKAPK